MTTENKNRVCLPAALLAAVMMFPTPIAAAQEMGTVVIDGLNSPMGVLVTPDGSVWVVDTGVGGDVELELAGFSEAEAAPDAEADADAGGLDSWLFGETARVVQLAADGAVTEVATLPSLAFPKDPTFNMGGARLAMIDGQLYVTSGGWWSVGDTERPVGVSAVLRIEDGHGLEVANTWDVEREQNPDGWERATNPYGLAAGPDGSLWVADAAANDLLKIDPQTGEVEVAAVFEGMPGPIPNAERDGALEIAPVPTGVAFDQAGALYVTLLPGVPFLPGSSKVVQVSAEGAVTDYATGLTMLTDLRAGPDGNLYGVSLGEFTEKGPTPNSGAVVRIMEGGAGEVVLSGISFPTSIDFSANGDAYVTVNGVGAPGTGQVVLYKGLVAGATSGQ
ncbi:MAG: ScyD/ScyE family protein [Gemmatimonadota bacterium]